MKFRPSSQVADIKPYEAGKPLKEFQREYNIEHVVHHMALVKIGIHEVSPYVILPPDFGVAISTIKYHKNQTEE
jgi:hypothetical protein